jgi:hypothetical protein
MIEYDSSKVLVRRDASGKGLGILVYAIAGPILAAFSGLISMALVAALIERSNRRLENLSTGIGLAVGGVIAVWLLWFAYHDLRRRLGAELVVTSDGVVMAFGGRRKAFTLAEIEGLRLARQGTQVVFEISGGRSIAVPLDLVRADELLPRLNSLLIDPLAQRLDERLATGDVLVSRDLSWRAVPLAAWCIMLIAAGAAALPTIRFAHGAIDAIQRGVVGLRQAWRGLRGGFRLEEGGLRGRGMDAALPWMEPSVKSDSAGLVIRAGTGRSRDAFRHRSGAAAGPEGRDDVVLWWHTAGGDRRRNTKGAKDRECFTDKRTAPNAGTKALTSCGCITTPGASER